MWEHAQLYEISTTGEQRQLHYVPKENKRASMAAMVPEMMRLTIMATSTYPPTLSAVERVRTNSKLICKDSEDLREPDLGARGSL